MILRYSLAPPPPPLADLFDNIAHLCKTRSEHILNILYFQRSRDHCSTNPRCGMTPPPVSLEPSPGL